jgi:undecaprenyl-diphosphatase
MTRRLLIAAVAAAAFASCYAGLAVIEGDLLDWRIRRVQESEKAPGWIKMHRREDLYFAFGGTAEQAIWALRAWCEPTVITALCGALLALEAGRRRLTHPARLLLALALAFGAAHAVKSGVARLRPIAADAHGAGPPWPGSWFPDPEQTTRYERASFPSSHAAAAMAVSCILFRLYPRLGWVVIPYGLGAAATRFLTLSHWPTDILVGAVLGWAAGEIVTAAAARIETGNPPPPPGDL